ncbi:uncharacterized protein LOC143276960 [Babylonia areolata]|uniref:uncharacterized protein LOC143276960 n=1 Tax=Babylonia areolata TaxID=304850 RepID=UPI003FD37DA5
MEETDRQSTHVSVKDDDLLLFPGSQSQDKDADCGMTTEEGTLAFRVPVVCPEGLEVGAPSADVSITADPASNTADSSHVMSPCSGAGGDGASPADASDSRTVTSTSPYSVAPQQIVDQPEGEVDAEMVKPSAATPDRATPTQQVSEEGDSLVVDSQPTRLESVGMLTEQTSDLQSGTDSGEVCVEGSGEGPLTGLEKQPLLPSPHTAGETVIPSLSFEADSSGGSCEQASVEGACSSQRNTSLFSGEGSPHGPGPISVHPEEDSPQQQDVTQTEGTLCTANGQVSDHGIKTEGTLCTANGQVSDHGIKTVFQHPGSHLAPDPVDGVTDGTDSCGTTSSDGEQSLDVSVRTENDSTDMEEPANSASQGWNHSPSDQSMESQMPPATKPPSSKCSKFSHNKENMLKKCSVVLIRQQVGNGSRAVRRRFSKSSKAKPHASSASKRSKPVVKQKRRGKRLAVTHTIKDCFVRLTCEHPSGKGDDTTPTVKSFPKPKPRRQPVSSHQHSQRRTLHHTSPGSIPLRECLVILTHKDPSFTAQERRPTRKLPVKLNSWHEASCSKRSTHERNSAPKSSHRAEEWKPAGKQQLSECFVVLSRDKLEVPGERRHPLKNIPANQDQNKGRGRHLTKVSPHSQAVKDCCVVLERDQPVVAQKHTVPRGKKLPSHSLLLPKSVSAPDENMSGEGKSVVSTVGACGPVKSCFVLLTRGESEGRGQRGSSQSSDATICMDLPEAADVPTWLVNSEHTRYSEVTHQKGGKLHQGEVAHQKEGKLYQGKNGHASATHASVLPHCSVVLSRLMESPSPQDGSPGNKRQISRLQRKRKSSSPARPFPFDTAGHLFPGSRSVSLFHEEPAEGRRTRNTAGSSSQSAAGITVFGQSQLLQRPDILKGDNSLEPCSREPARKKQGGALQTKDWNVSAESFVDLKNCHVCLARLPQPGAGKEVGGRWRHGRSCDPPPVKEQTAPCGRPGEVIDSGDDEATPSSPPWNQSRKKTGTVSRKQSSDLGPLSRCTTSPTKGCSVVLTRLQEQEVGRTRLYKDMPILHQGVSRKTERPAGKQTDSSEDSSATEDSPFLEQSAPHKQRAHGETDVSTEQCEEQEKKMSTRSLKQSVADKTERVSRTTPSVKRPVPKKNGRPARQNTHLRIDHSENGEEDTSNKHCKRSIQNMRHREDNSETDDEETHDENDKRSAARALSKEKYRPAGKGGRCGESTVPAEDTEAQEEGNHSDHSHSAPPSTTSTPGNTGRQARRGHTKPYTSAARDTPRRKKPRLSESTPLEQKQCSAVELKESTAPARKTGLDSRMSAAGIWIQPFSGKVDESQSAEGSQGMTLLSEPSPTARAPSTSGDLKTGAPQGARSDTATKSRTGPRKRGRQTPKSRKGTEQKRPKWDSRKDEETPSARGDSNSESEILLIGDDFIVIREQSDFEEDEEELVSGQGDGAVGGENAGKQILQQEEQGEKTYGGEETAGEDPSGDRAVAISLDETDGQMYMQVLPAPDEGQD